MNISFIAILFRFFIALLSFFPSFLSFLSFLSFCCLFRAATSAYGDSVLGVELPAYATATAAWDQSCL